MMLTDRDERALLAAAENRMAEPLRIGAALAAVRRSLGRRSAASARERESVACQPIRTPHPTQPPPPAPTPDPGRAPAPQPTPTRR
ncbi:hypothetical protein BGK67_26290 [Streptomyces subrutilus]|uniref:Uncharacterized protein n=1 Tax=Streptomyces subrutilus TaxID=36818 RepID=A0A1E5PXS8_9ACTN|nr:hypothetical protein BGK67_26290 [Streptomyces subrutilus]